MAKVLKKNKIYKLLTATIVPATMCTTTLATTSCSVTRVLFGTQGTPKLYLSSTPRVTHTLAVQNIDMHGTTFSYEITDTNIDIEVVPQILVEYTKEEDYVNGNVNIHYVLSDIFYSTVMLLPEAERDQKYVSLTTTFYDAGKTICKSVTSKFVYEKTPFIEQTINVISENGINPTTYYSGDKFAAGNYDPFSVINDYILPDPEDFTMDDKQKIANILNADIAMTIDRTIDNFRYCVLPIIELEFDILDINWNYRYDATTGEFVSIELNGNCKCSKYNAQAVFSAKFRNCKLLGAYNEDKSFGTPHNRYNGDEVYANVLQFVPQTDDDVDVTYSVNVGVPTFGLNISYAEKYFLNPRNFFGMEQFDTHGTERGFALMSYYLSNFEDNDNIDWLNNPPTKDKNPLQVVINPIDISSSINLTDVYIKNNWSHSDKDGKNKRQSTEEEFRAGIKQDGFTSRHVLDVKDSNPGDNYSNWIHTATEFVSCFPDTDNSGNNVNSFKKVTINGKDYPWYQIFNIIEYDDSTSKMNFYLNSMFKYNDPNHPHNTECDFTYAE